METTQPKSLSRQIEEVNLRFFFKGYLAIYFFLRLLVFLMIYLPALVMGIYTFVMGIDALQEGGPKALFTLTNARKYHQVLPGFISGFTLIMFFLTNACTNFARLPDLPEEDKTYFKKAAYGFLACTVSGLLFLAMVYLLSSGIDLFTGIRNSSHLTSWYFLLCKFFLVSSTASLTYALGCVSSIFWDMVVKKYQLKEHVEDSIKIIDKDLPLPLVLAYWVLVYWGSFTLIVQGIMIMLEPRLITGLGYLALFLMHCIYVWKFQNYNIGLKYVVMVLMVTLAYMSILTRNM
ncbi:hypothetical protein [Deinococcus cellulosilyticus]|uniref:Uncharacterized protein n=1 Tax=Deinococcus cellulosilyticus (strain DSM 18568 / NBRC 106333 / KACC 11606 / 5516J-15) TaxID=1223518 RepID=A0A511NBE2_DEIC1|nr:hypothetical protein [Deinococcus cellulosilyticus]GEM49838.1 hypothetical protein DC3_54730 [Deinococcus cellulosilyticus NBRC 106333 = KACC 11606]